MNLNIYLEMNKFYFAVTPLIWTRLINTDEGLFYGTLMTRSRTKLTSLYAHQLSAQCIENRTF